MPCALQDERCCWFGSTAWDQANDFLLFNLRGERAAFGIQQLHRFGP
jgi:hypothetical protein